MYPYLDSIDELLQKDEALTKPLGYNGVHVGWLCRNAAAGDLIACGLPGLSDPEEKEPMGRGSQFCDLSLVLRHIEPNEQMLPGESAWKIVGPAVVARRADLFRALAGINLCPQGMKLQFRSQELLLLFAYGRSLVSPSAQTPEALARSIAKIFRSGFMDDWAIIARTD
jgi:hypothetical protein